MLETTASVRNQKVAYKFRTPDTLEATPVAVKRILVVGSCMAAGLFHYAHVIFKGAEVDHVLYNYPGDLTEPPHPIEEYAFQLIHLPLRTIVPETMLSDIPHTSEEPFKEKLRECEQRLIQTFTGALAFTENTKLMTFVSECFIPQQNHMGRLLPRYDLRNPTYFVEQLNRKLHELALEHGAHMVQADAIAQTFGRKFIQEDLVWNWSHASYANDWDSIHDTTRIVQPTKLTSLYPINIEDFIFGFWSEIHAMYRTLTQQDSVKLVILDLDDTLWRGVVAEEGIHNRVLLEGWPLGLIEALKFLKQRGIVLAIVSKNDEATILDLWPQFLKHRLNIDDFAVRKINWRPKAENIQDILSETNLLPKNALFIDDNPVERESVQAAFPAMRVLGDELYSIRSTLLWAPETQVPYVTPESSRRTEMIQAQVQRETAKAVMTREEFLASLDVSVGIRPMNTIEDERFPRALELLNKSNQFNTTGKRWTIGECQQAFLSGAVFETFEVGDKYTDYGLVGIAIVRDHIIIQFVMSCRVVGLGVEQAVIAGLAANHLALKGVYTPTEANGLCRDLYQKCGFALDGGTWTLQDNAVTAPPHVKFREMSA
jgi:FkbH-like protein